MVYGVADLAPDFWMMGRLHASSQSLALATVTCPALAARHGRPGKCSARHRLLCSVASQHSSAPALQMARLRISFIMSRVMQTSGQVNTQQACASTASKLAVNGHYLAAALLAARVSHLLGWAQKP